MYIFLSRRVYCMCTVSCSYPNHFEISQPFCDRHLGADLELGPVPVGLVIGTSVPILKSRLLASKARQLLNRQRQFFQKKQVALLCNNMTYRSHDSSCFIIINIVRPTVFFAIGTEVPIAASRRNIPEFYRGTHKKWLGYSSQVDFEYISSQHPFSCASITT